MSADQQRLDALRKGITAANDNGYVSIRVADLRWLLDALQDTSSQIADAAHSPNHLNQPPAAFDLDKDLIDDADDQ